MAQKFAVCLGFRSNPRSTSPKNQQREIDFFEAKNYELALRRQDGGKDILSISLMVFDLFGGLQAVK